MIALLFAPLAHAGAEVTWSDGVITWTWAGTESDLLDGEPADGWVWVDDTQQSTPATVEDSLRVDADGDVYRVLSVDWDALDAKFAASAADATERWGEEPDLGESFDAPANEPYVGWAYDTPLTWAANDCGAQDEWVWNSESRTWVNSPMDNREEKAVLILLNGGTWCSGVMVDSDSVLTAAHCLWNSSGNAINVANLGVCSHENLQSGADCSTVEAKIIPSGYSHSSDPIGFDFALLDLDETDIADGEFMALSSSSDGTIAAADQDTTGYPGFLPSSCSGGSGTSNEISNNAMTVDDDYNGAKGFRQTGDITWTGSDWFGTTLDAVGGQSGSPNLLLPYFGEHRALRHRRVVAPAVDRRPRLRRGAEGFRV